MVLTKLLGVGAILLGLAIVVFFPYSYPYHQQDFMVNAGIIMGIIFIGIGLFLLSL